MGLNTKVCELKGKEKLLYEKEEFGSFDVLPEKCKRCSVDSSIVLAIAMTVECKQYRTGKCQCTMYEVLLKSSYKVLHEKGKK